MRLSDLDPGWLGTGGEGVSDAEGNPVPRREGVGIVFACPCGGEHVVALHLDPPLDGGPALPHAWSREGDSFETLTLRPSILQRTACGWHGFVTNGEVTTC